MSISSMLLNILTLCWHFASDLHNKIWCSIIHIELKLKLLLSQTGQVTPFFHFNLCIKNLLLRSFFIEYMFLCIFNPDIRYPSCPLIYDEMDQPVRPDFQIAAGSLTVLIQTNYTVHADMWFRVILGYVSESPRLIMPHTHECALLLLQVDRL